MNSIQKSLDSYYAHPASAIFPTSISYDQGIFLRKLLEKIKPKTLVEVGLGFGISFLWLNSSSFKTKKHIVIDPKQNEFKYYGKKVIQRYNFSQVDFIEEYSQEYLPKLIPKFCNKIDMFFLDGDIKFDGILTDLFFITKLLRIDGTLVVRNSWSPSVRKAISFTINNLPFALEGLTITESKLVKLQYFSSEVLKRAGYHRFHDFFVLKKISNDTRSWNDFHSF